MVTMRSLLVGVSFLALTAPAAHAQSGKPMVPPATTMQAEMSRFLVFFDWNKSTLTPEARRIIAGAAEEFRKSGAARVVATGYTDLSGSPAYNLRLSERRAEAVKEELMRLGVPESAIATIGKGEADPLVPTADGVREAQNRRVVIEFPRPPKAAEAPKPAPAAAAAPPPPPPPLKWSASLGPWYGYNLKETDNSRNTKTSSLLGPELRLGYHVTPGWQVYGDLVGWSTLDTSANDGYGGRGAIGLSHMWDLGAVHPFIGPKVGYLLGRGVQDSVFVGPEVGVNVDLARNMFFYSRIAYDSNFRNDFGQGIINGGLGAGMRF